MKLFLIFVLFPLISAHSRFHIREDITKQWDKLCEPYKSECIKESGINEDAATNIFNGDFPDEHKFKCYLRCLQSKLNYYKEDGEFNIDVIRSIAKGADLDVLEAMVNVASAEKDPCQKAYVFGTAVISKIGSRYPYKEKVNAIPKA